MHVRRIWLPLGTTYQLCNPGVAIEPAGKNDIVAEVYQENDRLKAQTWQVTLDTRSITTALKGISAKELTIVAAFSEYQHEVSSDLALSDVRAVTEGKFTGPPITIRSNEARLTFDGKTFKTKQDR